MESKCGDCPWRKSAEENPKAFKSRLWRWHTKICPGWKSYQRQLKREAAESGEHIA
jgi:hypothetical protein